MCAVYIFETLLSVTEFCYPQFLSQSYVGKTIALTQDE